MTKEIKEKEATMRGEEFVRKIKMLSEEEILEFAKYMEKNNYPSDFIEAVLEVNRISREKIEEAVW